MSKSIGAVEREQKEWLTAPALCAEHLSRGVWKRARHLDMISDRLAQMEHRPLRLIVTMPPRHGKSELISHWTPVWYLKRWPYKRVIITSYQTGYATEWGGTAKNSMIQHSGELGLELMRDTKAKARWQIKGYGGGMTAAGIGGPLTGRGGDLIIIDDPIKSQKEALSETYRKSTWEWYRATLRPRLQPGGSIVILMTRWHEDDLVGRLLTDVEDSTLYRDDWEVINLPALAEPNDPLGREEGDALWPEMYDEESLYQIREAVGSYWFSAEYLGAPRPEGGSIIKEAWFNYFSEAEDPLVTEIPIIHCIQSWDTGFEIGDQNSRTAAITIMETRIGFFIMDCWAKRVEFPDLVAITKAKYQQWLPERIYIEHKASGHSLVQQLRVDTKLPIIPVKVVADKEVRVHAISGIIEAGKVFLPARAPWLSEFLHEVCTFPSAKRDDITDAFVHGMMQLKPSLARAGRGYARRGYRRAPYARG